MFLACLRVVFPWLDYTTVPLIKKAPRMRPIFKALMPYVTIPAK